jgi:putative membrane protein
MLKASIKKNDQQALWLISIFSIVVFSAIVLLSRYHLQLDLGFDVHIFAAINAVINTVIAILLILALIAVRNKRYLLHKKLMVAALLLSVIFLVSYIAHHLLAGEAKFGDINHDGLLSDEEKLAVGPLRYFYYLILATHIFLAAVILPFILFTAYRALTAEFVRHKKLARITWPLWMYVAVTGPIVYVMISPYYH